MEAFASQRLCEEYNKEKRRVMCDRHVYTVNQAEVEVAMLLPRFCMAGTSSGMKRLMMPYVCQIWLCVPCPVATNPN